MQMSNPRRVPLSVVVTVKNERDAIAALLHDLVEQSAWPAEIVIVDGRSDDDTIAVVREAQEDLPVRVLECEGNIARGRNVGVSAAVSECIVVTDAGCRLSRDWLEGFHEEFSRGAKVVQGTWRAVGASPFERGQMSVLYPEGGRGASARSLGFTKTTWALVGGFPEELAAAEDSLFVKRLATIATVGTVKAGVAEWRVRPGVQPLFRQVRAYAQWDIISGQSVVGRLKIPVAYAATAVALWVVPLLGVPGLAVLLARPLLRGWRQRVPFRLWGWVLVAGWTVDAGGVAGASLGVFLRWRGMAKGTANIG